MSDTWRGGGSEIDDIINAHTCTHSLTLTHTHTHTIVVHDLGASQLLVGGVDLSAQDLVEGTRPSQNDVRVFNLYDSLAKTNKISTDTNGTTSHLKKERKNHNIVNWIIMGISVSKSYINKNDMVESIRN